MGGSGEGEPFMWRTEWCGGLVSGGGLGGVGMGRGMGGGRGGGEGWRREEGGPRREVSSLARNVRVSLCRGEGRAWTLARQNPTSIPHPHSVFPPATPLPHTPHAPPTPPHPQYDHYVATLAATETDLAAAEGTVSDLSSRLMSLKSTMEDMYAKVGGRDNVMRAGCIHG